MKWRWVKDYRNYYRVSQSGSVRSVSRRIKITRKDGTTRPYFVRGGILKPGLREGYPSVVLCKEGKTTTIHVHRLVAEAFIPNPKNLPEVNHKDLNKLNNQADNLEWSTRRKNAHHAAKGFVYTQGEEHRSAKLTASKVKYIRKTYAKGKTSYSILAKKFKVTITAIKNVVLNRTWKSVSRVTV